MRSKFGNRISLLRRFTIALIIVFSTGCAKFTKYEYESHVFPLDEENELVISTFPSWFPKTKGHIPFLFKSSYAPQSVYFQFFVRATGTTAGRNPNIESINVRRFSYEFPGQNAIVLVENYSDGFWQQGQADFDSKDLEPVPCVDGWYVRVKYDLILNRTVFNGEQILYAKEKSKVYPLVFDALR